MTTSAPTELVEVEPAAWDATLPELGLGDAYLRRAYVEASCLLDPGRPRFLRLGRFGFAAIDREIPGSDGLRDVTTPYGYGGPAGGDGAGAFYAAYDEWCRANRVVTTFVRFHPLLENWRAAPPAVRRERLANTATWPLDGHVDLAAGMHQMHRRGARKAERAGVEAAFTRGPEGLDAFAALYEETMRRRDAEGFYYFPTTYWAALARGLRDDIVVADARLDGETVASLLLLAAPPWLHYHLGATSEHGFAVGASKLLFLAAAHWGRAHGFGELHLGSGLGGREDSLWQFKQRFSPHPGRDFWIGKLVHDQAAYRELAGEAGVEGFFPAYRAAQARA